VLISAFFSCFARSLPDSDDVQLLWRISMVRSLPLLVFKKSYYHQQQHHHHHHQ
jgi:hypothetical protein